MFGFGDQWPANHETVDLVESLVDEYVGDLAQRAIKIARTKGGLDKECFMYCVRTDERKFSRIKRLLAANEEIKHAKTQTNEDIAQEVQLPPR